MTNLCEKFSKISNYSSEEVLCCEQENENGSGCKVSNDNNCVDKYLLAQCRKISDLGKACERDDGSGDKELTDKICKDANNDKWLCLATNDTRNNDNNPDWDAQRNWVITGRLLRYDKYQPEPSRNSLVDSPISCGACCNSTDCVHMSNGNYKGSCLNADGFNKWCQSSDGNWTVARVKCPDMFQLGNQTCEVVPFSSDNPILRTISYQADLCDGFLSNSNRGLTIDGKALIITSVAIFILGAFVVKTNWKWLLKKWRKFRGKKEVNDENVPSEQGSEIESTEYLQSNNDSVFEKAKQVGKA
ncbi:hypothetical protein GLOIN_2v1762975 [Rhizophagus clarus]|uniref:Uncharacterized protein n=1 Tax=Rhizophagus clarus TaxID=94130 RepID=A0A8H3QHH8_9GLOM|nr:hypothetical protein GLOIN_2v1762975 [Rhizophagus clarus]